MKEKMKEKCIMCSKVTDYYITDNIDRRNYYVEGCGQLCKECFDKVYLKETLSNTKKAHFLCG